MLNAHGELWGAAHKGRAEAESELEEAENRGLIERDHLRLWPTLKGRRFLNDLLEIFLES